mmetsp:Transcript_23130/g.72757  ORF Transcript_23130/g.72757 Transcript_23130/m.72757 type:complete len:399 (+) Transcript_23130:588-1784(+)
MCRGRRRCRGRGRVEEAPGALEQPGAARRRRRRRRAGWRWRGLRHEAHGRALRSLRRCSLCSPGKEQGLEVLRLRLLARRGLHLWSGLGTSERLARLRLGVLPHVVLLPSSCLNSLNELFANRHLCLPLLGREGILHQQRRDQGDDALGGGLVAQVPAHGVVAAQEAHADRGRPVRFREFLKGGEDHVRDGGLVKDLKDAAEPHEHLHLHLHGSGAQQQLQHPRQDLVLHLAVLELLVQIRHLFEHLVQNHGLLQLQAAEQERQQDRLRLSGGGQVHESVQFLEEQGYHLYRNLLGAEERLHGRPDPGLEVGTVGHLLPLEHGDEDGHNDAVEAREEQRTAKAGKHPLPQDPLAAERRLGVLQELRKAAEERHPLRLVLLVQLLEEPDRSQVDVHEEL